MTTLDLTQIRTHVELTPFTEAGLIYLHKTVTDFISLPNDGKEATKLFGNSQTFFTFVQALQTLSQTGLTPSILLQPLNQSYTIHFTKTYSGRTFGDLVKDGLDPPPLHHFISPVVIMGIEMAWKEAGLPYSPIEKLVRDTFKSTVCANHNRALEVFRQATSAAEGFGRSRLPRIVLMGIVGEVGEGRMSDGEVGRLVDWGVGRMGKCIGEVSEWELGEVLEVVFVKSR